MSTRPAAKAKARAAWFHLGDSPRLEIRHTPWWRHIRRDYRRHRATGESAPRIVLLSQGFWASCVYRMAHALRQARAPRLLKLPFIALGALAQKAAEIVTGISIPDGAEIGEGLYIGHFGGIVLDRAVRIGHNCNLAQNVTLQNATIGNRVFIGTHSIVVGKITVGDDAVICAGSVVTKPVPPRAVVLGNPARVISYDGSFEYVIYDGMHADLARKASLELARGAA